MKEKKTLIIHSNVTEATLYQVDVKDLTQVDIEELLSKYMLPGITWYIEDKDGLQMISPSDIIQLVPVNKEELTDAEKEIVEQELSDIVELPSLDEIDTAQRFPVVEAFSSIQGEGAFIGMPTTFIRLAGCDMACPWCDSKDTWKKPDIEEDFQKVVQSYIEDYAEQGCDPDTAFLDSLDHSDLSDPWAESVLGRKWLSIAELADLVNKSVVVITGGEPCIHKNLQDLVLGIKYLKKDLQPLVCIETNGAQATPDGIDWVVCSPKPGAQYKIHPECKWDELKYVVDDNFDVSVVPEKILSGEIPAGVCWLQPCDIRYGMPKNERLVIKDAQGDFVSKSKDELSILEATEASWKKCYDLAMEYSCFRVGIQLHKFMGAR